MHACICIYMTSWYNRVPERLLLCFFFPGCDLRHTLLDLKSTTKSRRDRGSVFCMRSTASSSGFTQLHVCMYVYSSRKICMHEMCSDVLLIVLDCILCYCVRDYEYGVTDCCTYMCLVYTLIILIVSCGLFIASLYY